MIPKIIHQTAKKTTNLGRKPIGQPLKKSTDRMGIPFMG